MSEVSKEVQEFVLGEEITAWKNTRYQLQIRYRVNKAIGNEQACRAIEDELAKCELALDELEKIRGEA